SVSLDAGADGSVEQTTTTDANGNFSFADLGPGTYRVRAAGQTGAIQTTTSPGDVTVQSAVNPGGLDFGLFVLAKIQGQPFEDSTGTTAGTPGEPMLSTWVVCPAPKGAGVLGAGEPNATTDAGGNFSFANLVPGTYRLREVLQTGFLQSTA